MQIIGQTAADARAVVRSWADDPRTRLKLEVRALRLALVPHDANNNFRKLVLLIFLTVWALLSLDLASINNLPSQTYTALTALVFLIAGRMWGVEVSALDLPVSFASENGEEATDDD